MATPEEMDEAAETAEQELMELLDTATAMDLIKWWKRHYMQAGYKRLGRILAKLDTNG